MLSQTMRVLDWDDGDDYGDLKYHGGLVIFSMPPEDGPSTVVSFDEEAWVQLGRPTQITVTITPGDLFNEMRGQNDEPVRSVDSHIADAHV